MFNIDMIERSKSTLRGARCGLALFTAATIAATLLAIGNAHALGLGNLEVQSNLDQPLRGSIDLRVAEGDDLNSISVMIASRDEFDRLGVDYPEYLNDIAISLELQGGKSILRITSNDVIIREPFIQFLVRVDWTGGSFLREYTALIDPPTYAADTPRAVAEPQAVGTDRDYEGDNQVEQVDETYTELESDSSYEEQVSDEPEEYTGNGFEQSGVSGSLPTDARYGPVTAGESLGLIAEDLQRQFPDLSIYQIMMVLFEENPDAFIDGNINGLIKGAILNIGDLDRIRAVNVSDGRRFFQAQLSAWDSSAAASSGESLSVASDEYAAADSYSSDAARDSQGDGESRDNFQVGSSTDVGSYVSSAGGGSSDGEVIALQQQLTDLETSLSSSRLENQELAERISILETQLADMNRLMELNVEDAEMASLEAALARQNAPYAVPEEESDYLIDEPDQVIAGADESLASDELPTLDDGLEQGLGGETDESVASQDAAATDVAATDVATTDVASADSAQVVQSEPVSLSKSESGFFDKLKATVVDTGIWRIVAGAGAVLLGVLGLLILRRRRADEEFEISMLSIGSQSQTIDDFADKTVTEINPNLAAAAVPGGGDRDTSFLTVYTDTDAVVQADEVDPIAEADVYIAYGRDEQAEEVLLDGAANYPNRADIKHKLLNLYHKNTNVEGFERLAEELYAQRGSLSAGAWQDVVRMGKSIAPENPIFELSSDELATADKVVTQLEDDADFADEEVPAKVPDKEVIAEQPVDDEIEHSVLEFDPEADDSVQEEPPASDDPIDRDTEQAVVEAEAEAAAIADEVARAEAEVERTIEAESQNSAVAYEAEADASAAGAEEEKPDDQDADEIRLAEEDDESSINLINFHDGRSEMSELDQVELSALSRATESEIVNADTVEIDLAVNAAAADAGDSEKAGVDHSIAADISDFEVDKNYDEARTQFELAKVFVDLGDEDGARKILNDIIENKDNSEAVVADANELLQSIAG